ncbi:hypothetical protein M407DRAFT_18107 [Tulasnella calospora MUT 4182]|uniref:Uncharacterized protein n=1 Tax=Tulasnella calospora MUT 4182 TaxID=1051891 RepID=A0A0C3QKD2_9AGAM|nr:hypothetical protein M407DRAFT_18107 [Tulasnella calospora MUT 4182]
MLPFENVARTATPNDPGSPQTLKTPKRAGEFLVSPGPDNLGINPGLRLFFKSLWFNESAKKKNDSDPAATATAAAAAAAAPAALIPRPPGEKGKNGWNLQEVMSLKDDDGLYAEILRAARHCISRSGLDWDSTYSEQDPGRLAACFRELKKQQPYLERFQGDWPAKEMVISALQNRRKTRTAKTKAKLATDQVTQNEMARVDEAIAAE